MGWRGYIDEAHHTVFFWSQKAACTTLFRFLADNMQTPPASKRHFVTGSVPLKQCRAAIEAKGLRTAILVRHPVTRIISAYFNKFCLYQDRVLESRDQLEVFAQELHDHFRTLTGTRGDENEITFEQFLDTVEDMMAHRIKPDHPINGHWETQMPPYLAREHRTRLWQARTLFRRHSAGLHYDHVVRVEALDAGMRQLARACGMRYTPRTENRTDLARGPRHEGYLGDVPARDVAGYAFGHANFITDATLAQIGRMYAADFESFGYELAP